MDVQRRQLGRHTTVLFGHEQGKYPDGNSVLVRGSSGTVLIDPSLGVRDITPPLTVDHVLLTHTHEDHAAGVSAVRWGSLRVHHHDVEALRSVDALMALYGVPRSVWPEMTDFVTGRFHFAGWPEARGMSDGETIDLGDVRVTLIHAPGHTSGHSLYLIEGDDGVRVVVTGDIDLTGFGAYYGDAASSLDSFERTLRMARELVADHYVTFHHKGVVDGHTAFVAAVDAYAESFQRREDALLTLVASPRSLDELVAEGIVYRAGTRPALFGDSVERRTIEQHLERLLANGAVEVGGGQYWRR
jgi:glyoxylase-like metal-dependent hydrolase (beta-lactamase superfamily II)